MKGIGRLEFMVFPFSLPLYRCKYGGSGCWRAILKRDPVLRVESLSLYWFGLLYKIILYVCFMQNGQLNACHSPCPNNARVCICLFGQPYASCFPSRCQSCPNFLHTALLLASSSQMLSFQIALPSILSHSPPPDVILRE